MTTPPEDSQVSPDGAWRWDGTTWVPNAPAGQAPLPAEQPVPNQPAYAAQPAYGAQPVAYPPQPGAYPPQPVKKSHTLRNVLLVIVALMVLFIGGCLALLGTAANEVGKAIDEAESQDAQPGGPDNPLTIKEGEGFDVYGFKYQAGWSVGADAVGDVDIRNLKFENKRDEADSAIVEIKFLDGNEVVAATDCTSDEAEVGQIVTLTCFSADDLPQVYDTITINDTF